MKARQSEHIDLIVQTYQHYRTEVVSYIYYRIENNDDAQDMYQDIFLRLLEYDKMICENTVKSLIYTIARNMIIDYLRRHNTRREYEASLSFVSESKIYSSTPHEEASVADLKRKELHLVNRLTPRCREVYRMTRFDGLSAEEISDKLGLSKRTVEVQLLTSRKFVRTELRKII